MPRTQTNREMAQAWAKPEFSGLAGMFQAIEKSENAEFAPVTIGGREIPNRVGIRGAESGEPFGICSRRYAMVQNKELFSSLGIALENMNADVSGSIISAEGKTKMVLLVGNPIDLHDSSYRLMIVAENSYNGEVAWGGMSALMRLICLNGLMGLAGVCASFHQKHTLGLEERIAEWGSFIERASVGAEQYGPLMQTAQSTVIPNLEMVLRGGGFGPRIVAKVISEFDRLVPEAIGRPATQYDAGMALTNYYSNRKLGNWNRNTEGLELAGRFMQTPMEELIVKGREALTVTATP